MTVLQANGLTHRYPSSGRPALDGVTFSLQEGRLVFVLGPNGSGKSTLFRILLRLLKPRSGRVQLVGRELSDFSAAQLADVISYIPQTHDIAFDFPARHTVVLGRVARRGWTARPSDEDWDYADEALDRVGIPHLAFRGMRELSGGECQLVLIARALCQGGRLLVLDEPTSALDAGNQVRILDRIRSLADAGLTVLLSSHQPTQALQYADDVLLLSRGRTAGVVPAADIDEDALTDLYDIPFRIVSSPDLPGMRLCFASSALGSRAADGGVADVGAVPTSIDNPDAQRSHRG